MDLMSSVSPAVPEAILRHLHLGIVVVFRPYKAVHQHILCQAGNLGQPCCTQEGRLLTQVVWSSQGCLVLIASECPLSFCTSCHPQYEVVTEGTNLRRRPGGATKSERQSDILAERVRVPSPHEADLCIREATLSCI